MHHFFESSGSSERGSSVVEFTFLVPVILLITGATIDISRYMRTIQVTTFVSQEAANQIYKQCSDITVFSRPTASSTQLAIDDTSTQAAIQTCIDRIQTYANNVLQESLGGTEVSASVFRANPASCGTNPSTGQPHQKVSSANPGAPTLFQNVVVNGSASTSQRRELTADQKGFFRNSKASIDNNGDIMQGSLVGSSDASTRKLVTKTSFCARGRVVVIEVGYAFNPIVKFLPHIMTKPGTNGLHRETTVI